MRKFIHTLAMAVADAVVNHKSFQRLEKKLNTIMADQDTINADVDALAGAFTALSAELSDLEAYKAAHPDAPASSLDLSKLNAIVAKFEGIIPPSAPATTPSATPAAS